MMTIFRSRGASVLWATRLGAGLAALLAAQSPLHAQRVAFNTTGPLYRHVVNPNRGYEDLMVPGIVIANDRATALVLDSLEIEVVGGTRVLSMLTIDPADARSATEELAQMKETGLASVIEMSVAPRVLGAQQNFGTGDTLRAGASLVGPVSYVAVHGAPAFVRARADMHGPDGKRISIWSRALRVVTATVNHYSFPLNGSWYASSIPG